MKTRLIVATLVERNSLEKTVSSIVKQNLSDLEVIFVLPKNKSEIVEKICEKENLKNYRILIDEKKGLSHAINQGFGYEGDFEYFSWINDDDELTAFSLQRSINFLDNQSNYLAVVGSLNYRILDKNKIRLNQVNFLTFVVATFGPNIIPQPGSLIRRKAITWNDLLNSNYKYAMDLDLFLRIRKIGKIGKIKQIQAIMNWHVDSITASNRKKANKEAFQIRLVYAENIFVKIMNYFFYFPTIILLKIFSRI